MEGEIVKQKWQTMRLEYVGRVGDVMRGEQGTNFDPGHNDNHKLGGGGPTG